MLTTHSLHAFKVSIQITEVMPVAVSLMSLFLLLSLSLSSKISEVLPGGFSWGVATSAYQIEGAWNEDGKGLSDWDVFVHKQLEKMKPNATGDVACDSYHKFQDDLDALKMLGVTHYRFSLSWTRILPNGSGEVNQPGVDYYNMMIDNLLENGIQPFVTIYHWEHPQVLEDQGGWLNESMVEYFGNYARTCYQLFGDRVKTWLTINEPAYLSLAGYGTGVHAPGKTNPSVGEYLSGHNLLKAHAVAYHIYDEEFREEQKGRVSFSLSSPFYVPLYKTKEDIAATERALQFQLGWFANPVYSAEGDYPAIMREYIDDKSKEEGLSQSRLPVFTPEWIDYIKGTHDFFGLNHYTTYKVADVPVPCNSVPNTKVDANYIRVTSPDWGEVKSSWQSVPFGFRDLLLIIKELYNNPEIVVTENGFGNTEMKLQDEERIRYIESYVDAMVEAIEQGVNVTAYTYWSLMDNFEWESGYTSKFGLFYVDFDDENLRRIPRESANYYANLIQQARRKTGISEM